MLSIIIIAVQSHLINSKKVEYRIELSLNAIESSREPRH